MPVAVLIGLVVAALAVLGIVYFAWRIEQDVAGGASAIVPVVVIGGGALLLWVLWRRV